MPIPTESLPYLARLLPPIGIIVGLYIFWIGADLPGGKFQGATILAAMWLLVIEAGLADTTDQPDLVAGPARDRPLVFIAIGFMGLHTASGPAYPGGL